MEHKKQLRLIILCWAAYTIAYLGRYSYTSNATPIMAFYGVEKVDYSLATTLFFFAYGAGQIVNGLLCNRYNMKVIIPVSLIASVTVNTAVFLGLPFTFIKYAWLINGVAQSFLWSSLILILSRNLDAKHMKTAVLFMSTTVSIGTFSIYGASAGFALLGTFAFKYSFLLSAALMLAVALIWIFSFDKLSSTRVFGKLPVKKPEDQELAQKTLSKPLQTERAKSGTLKGVIIIVALFGIYAVADNLIKDGLHAWVPVILKEQYGLPDSLSIILTLVLPLFGVLGAGLAVTINRFIKNHSDILGLFFLVSALMIGGILLVISTELWVILLALFGVVTMVMHGANNVLTSIMPLDVGRRYNAGLIAGLVNGACYVGSTLSQYLIASIAETAGWNAVFITLLCTCAAPVIISMAYTVIRLIKTQGKDLY